MLFLFFASLSLFATLVVGCGEEVTQNQSNTPQENSGNSDDLNVDISVHGHWMIQVRDPDGTLVNSQEFDNALTGQGVTSLVHFLGRTNSVGGWILYVGCTTAEDSPWSTTQNLQGWGAIYESSIDTEEWVYAFNNLTLSIDDNVPKLTLSGTAIAEKDGIIDEVYSAVERLDPSLPPSNPYNSQISMFSHTTLEQDINVSAVQYVFVSVQITFSGWAPGG